VPLLGRCLGVAIGRFQPNSPTGPSSRAAAQRQSLINQPIYSAYYLMAARQRDPSELIRHKHPDDSLFTRTYLTQFSLRLPIRCLFASRVIGYRVDACCEPRGSAMTVTNSFVYHQTILYQRLRLHARQRNGSCHSLSLPSVSSWSRSKNAPKALAPVSPSPPTCK
jgi:hypothetical protein